MAEASSLDLIAASFNRNGQAGRACVLLDEDARHLERCGARTGWQRGEQKRLKECIAVRRHIRLCQARGPELSLRHDQVTEVTFHWRDQGAGEHG